MRYTVVLTDRACADLRHAREYIRQHAPEAAERWYLNFLFAMRRLEQQPEALPLAPESAQFNFELRQL